LKKNVLLCQNEVWSSTLNTIYAFLQCAVKLSSLNCPIPFDDSWRTMAFIIKTTFQPSNLIKCQWNSSIMSPSKIFLMLDVQMIVDVRFNKLLLLSFDFHQSILHLFVARFVCLILELAKYFAFFWSFKPNLLFEYSIFSRSLWMDLGVESILYDGCNQVVTLRIALSCLIIWRGWNHRQTIVCHFYNSTYCKVIIIIVYDMQIEGIEGQFIFGIVWIRSS